MKLQIRNKARRLGRREFIQQTLGVCTTAAAGYTIAGLGSSRPVRADEQPKQSSHKYFDIHTHLAQPWTKQGPLGPDDLLRWMDYQGIKQAAVLPLISPESWYYPITTQWVLKQTQKHRDRLIPFCAVDPRSVYLGGYKGFLDILKRYTDAGARGFGEHKWGGPIDDSRNMELFRACAELKLPVLFHMDSVRNTDQPGLPGLEKVLKAFPEGKFIGHANGFWASLSANAKQQDFHGYPRGPIVPGGALDRLMEEYKNLYGDLSANSGANAIRRDKQFAREFVIRRQDQLLFGTDYLRKEQEVSQFELCDSLKLPQEVEEKIYYDNAARILGLT